MNENIIIDYERPGVYVLFNLKNHKAYVGKSRNVKKRLMQHCYYFHNKNSGNEMYLDDMGDFVSLLVHQIPDDMYEMFSNAYEIGCMVQLWLWGIKLYNKNPRAKSYGDYCKSISAHFLYAINSEQSVKDSFINQCNVAPWNVKFIKGKDANIIKKRNIEYKQHLAQKEGEQ